MSSSGSNKPPDQSLEPTEMQNSNSHRDRDSRPINGGASGSYDRDQVGGKRQTADRRRRHKSRGPNVNEPRTSASALTSGSGLDHSDRLTSTGSSPAPARTLSNNRNRVPHPATSRPVTSHVQDRRPQGSGQSGQQRRAVRPNPALSLPKADATVSPSDASLPRKRGKAPSGDDLTSILIFSLSNPPFPECMICFNPIRPEQPTWSCSPREEKEAQSCWNTFHLKCIQPWADKSVKDIEEAWRSRGEEKKGEWRCPGCQSKREIVPRKYWCFCGLAQDPNPPRSATPHSCGNSCSRARICGHPCPLPCHPGPCPPCMITVQNPCHCGKDVVALVCSRANPTTGGRVNLPASRSCGSKCGKPLSCQNHVCTEVCHDSQCSPCTVSDLARCWCGQERRRLACGEGDAKECKILTAAGEESWTGKFGCDNPYPSTVVFTNVQRRAIHPHSLAPKCPYSPSAVTRCPCGKHPFSGSADPSHFSHNAKLIRTACTDPIPTCTSLCEKPLEGCSHSCHASCHTGPCPPCAVTLVRPCRCGATTRSVTCSTEKAEAEAYLCNKPCGALRACGHHQCTRLCCPLANLANVTSKGKKKASGNIIPAEFADVGGWHLCDVVCGKLLSCGNHPCEERDHRGSCPPCLQSSFEEISCHCGRTVLEPPISCGTEITCPYPCVRPPPPCGHPRAPHLCHEDPTSCPPCVFLTEKLCACGKTMVGNIRCSQEKVSCGKPCGRLLECGFHTCEQLCHTGACASCTTDCGKPRKLCLPAHHPCTRPCHAPSACPEVEPCTATSTITCACGRIQQSVQCGQTTSSSAKREDVLAPRCTNECELAKRNARLAEALGINPDIQKMQGTVVYSDELVAFARHNAKFVGLVEKTFAEFVSSDKRVQVLPSMPETKRKFVHDLAAVYRMDTHMVDREPHRSVQLIRRIDTRIPANLLSQSPATNGAPGKLVDLRAPARAPPAVASAGSGPLRVSRGWNSVVTTPRARTPPSAAPNTNALSTWTSPMVSERISRSSTPSQLLTQPTVAEAAAAASSIEVVPDSWEDDF
ncbi:hypothetical protein F5148DRAFT_1181382 [Russula earlei]|uniref:Uncharacterized protein n=1 Tax=Russula earlei TaxID=71964 RepID=A0ACC0UEM6_9AGAM|nr:hypothetical protein F5148DRAFT_1181382 [Russula earlei]